MPLDAYREWKQKNKHVGCVFARLMAVDPARYGHRAELIEGTASAPVAAAIDARVTAAVADPSLNGLALVMPEVTDLGALTSIALALATHAGWSVTRSKLAETPIGDVVAFHVTRQIPFGDATCPSEALILGPFPDAFPNTRCAPHAALEIYVGAPPASDFMGKPTTKAHLALVDVGLPPKLRQNMFEQTKKIRLESLGGIDDSRAKAKVAFSVPMELATSLGCAL